MRILVTIIGMVSFFGVISAQEIPMMDPYHYGPAVVAPVESMDSDGDVQLHLKVKKNFKIADLLGAVRLPIRFLKFTPLTNAYSILEGMLLQKNPLILLTAFIPGGSPIQNAIKEVASSALTSVVDSHQRLSTALFSAFKAGIAGGMAQKTFSFLEHVPSDLTIPASLFKKVGESTLQSFLLEGELPSISNLKFAAIEGAVSGFERFQVTKKTEANNTPQPQNDDTTGQTAVQKPSLAEVKPPKTPNLIQNDQSATTRQTVVQKPFLSGPKPAEKITRPTEVKAPNVINSFIEKYGNFIGFLANNGADLQSMEEKLVLNSSPTVNEKIVQSQSVWQTQQDTTKKISEIQHFPASSNSSAPGEFFQALGEEALHQLAERGIEDPLKEKAEQWADDE